MRTGGVAVTLPKPQTSRAKSAGRFGKPDFVYLAKDDVYRCPAARSWRTTSSPLMKMARKWRIYLTKACRTCRFQGSVHNVQRAPHQTLGTRTRSVEAAQSAASIKTRKPCVCAAKPLSIRSPH